MIASERFQKIIEAVNEREIVTTKEMAEFLNVTETTIRRDCEELERQGELIRVHGGAKRVEHKEILSNLDEKVMKDRTERYEEKDMVCRKAASFVRDGDCVFLDGGTSIVPMLKYLKGKRLKIVTHSMLIANAFENTDSELFVIGGKYIPEYGMSVGPITQTNLEKFNFDCAFLSCAGADMERRMIYTAEMDTMAVKQLVMRLAVKNFLLLDSSKLHVKGFYSFISSDDFDAVVCNDDPAINHEELAENFILLEKNDDFTN
ncbi:MAG: DeoR/GlpR family DNA-binding transcription regulator [Anaerostipes sp.]|uniref:DeoR/GlpR family DNA-binding transcription regulator n=1 Tax=Anaerostipes sp. TaxID=1872530 RepID=UPI003992EC64